MIVFAFGSVDTSTSHLDTGGNSAQPGTSRQSLEPRSNDVPRRTPSEDGGAAESAVASDPVEAARAELAAADQRLKDFDANNLRPKPSPGPDRIWFAAEGGHTFHGSAIDVGHDTVTLRAYKDGRTVEIPIAKLDKQHHGEIAELFADYQQAVADWNEKRRPLKDAVDERKKSLEKALAAKAEREREAERERQRIAEQKAVEAKEARKAAAEEARKKQIEKHFSVWDGSHRGLTKVIKESMNDPNSYEHAETRYIDKGDHLIVITEFRGKNAFGGVVKNSVTAKVDLNGNVVEIIAQSP